MKAKLEGTQANFLPKVQPGRCAHPSTPMPLACAHGYIQLQGNLGNGAIAGQSRA